MDRLIFKLSALNCNAIIAINNEPVKLNSIKESVREFYAENNLNTCVIDDLHDEQYVGYFARLLFREAILSNCKNIEDFQNIIPDRGVEVLKYNKNDIDILLDINCEGI